MEVAVLGGPAEAEAARVIQAAVPGAVDLTCKTRVVDLAGLGAQAALTVGNDTGPTHWAAYAGSPGVMVMARVSREGHCEPRARMRTLMVEDLKALPLEAVTASLLQQGLIPGRTPA